MIDLHLFSSPGENDILDIFEASRPYLAGKPDASLAFLPQASLNVSQSLDETVRAFDGLARVVLIDTERMDLPTREAVIWGARGLYPRREYIFAQPSSAHQPVDAVPAQKSAGRSARRGL